MPRTSLFGNTVEQVQELRRRGYHPLPLIAGAPELAEAIDLLQSDFLCLGDRWCYAAVAESLRRGDHYMVCADFASFVDSMREAVRLYASAREWARRVVFNIAAASRFSSDATIRAYAREISGISPIKAEIEAQASAP